MKRQSVTASIFFFSCDEAVVDCRSILHGSSVVVKPDTLCQAEADYRFLAGKKNIEAVADCWFSLTQCVRLKHY